MLVSGGNLFHHGKVMGLGEPITDVENWRGSSLQIHLSTGAILDVTPEEAERLREKQVKKDYRAKGQRAIRDYEKAKYRTQAAAGQVESLTKQLKDAEQVFQDAEQAEFEAADKLAGLRERYGDEALGYIPSATADEPEPVEPQDEEPAADEPDGFSALTPDELRAKAIGAVGGFTRLALVGKMSDWWGIDIYGVKSPDDKLLIPKGAKKPVIREAALKIFEARYRIAELTESLKLEASQAPNQDALLAVSLGAIGAVVPSDAEAALEAWKDIIKPTEAEPAPEAGQTEDGDGTDTGQDEDEAEPEAQSELDLNSSSDDEG